MSKSHSSGCLLGAIKVEHRGLAFEAEDRAIHIRFAQQHAGVVHQVAGGEVVGAIADDVVRTHDVECVLTAEGGFVEIHLAVGVDLENPGFGRFDLRFAHPAGAMDHLPLQVGVIHHVEVHDADSPNAGGGQIEQQR